MSTLQRRGVFMVLPRRGFRSTLAHRGSSCSSGVTSQTERLIALAARRLPFKCRFDENLLRRSTSPYMWVMN